MSEARPGVPAADPEGGRRTVLITGSTSPLGRAIALAFAADGCALGLHYRASKEKAEALAADCRARGAEGWPLAGDLRKEEDARSVLGEFLERAGSLEVLI